MKLVRLETDNNGFFKSSFGNDMLLKANAKMALLNLTFEVDAEIFEVTPLNSEVTFFCDGSDGTTEVSARLLERKYTRLQIDEFYDDLVLTLNSAIANVAGSNGPGSCFDFRTLGGKKQIEYRYSPFLNPLFLPDQNNIMMLDNSLVVPVTTASVTSISKNPSILTPSDSRRANIITGLGAMCQGNGRCIIRVANLVDNGSGLQDNGFGMGLSNTPLTTVIVPGDDLTRSSPTLTDFEIRVNRPGENYQYIENGAALETDSGVPPVLVAGGNADDHDVMFFEIVGGTLIAGVLTTNGATPTKNIFFEYDIQPGEQFFPYVYFRGISTTCSANMFNYTIDPWVNQGQRGIGEDEPPYWDITGLDNPDNIHNASKNGVLSVVTSGTIFGGTGLNAFVLPDPANWLIDKTSQLDMPASIWNFFGYGLVSSGWVFDRDSIESKVISIGLNFGRQCWSAWIPNNPPLVETSDNFIVESMTLPLDSFDASRTFYGTLTNPPEIRTEAEKKGRRKNILMTIPVNDNTSGLVEYEASNLIFIDINNPEPLNVRNLNFRILTKNFVEINQSGSESAVLTVLIDG